MCWADTNARFKDFFSKLYHLDTYKKDLKCNRNQEPSHYFIRIKMFHIKYKISKIP